MAQIIHITAATGNYPNGQKIDKAVIEYDRPLDSKVTADTFAVEGRTVTGAEVNGRTVILRLDPEEEGAVLLQEPAHEPRKPGQKPVPPIFMPPVTRRPVRVTVTQLLPIRDADGNEITPDGAPHVSDRASEPVVESFVQGEYAGIRYNLYIPENVEPDKRYPLVLFIHDAGPCGPDPKITLSQGLGAVGFADPTWQREHPCFVLAPQIDRGIYLTSDDFVCSKELEDIKALLDHIVDSNPVDRKRLYTTGQSMGCMASCELNIRYPELFAASLLVAGQWSPERMERSCSQNQFWILVSEHDFKAFPGMNAVTEALERGGAAVARYRWDGAAGPEQLTQCAKAAMMDKVNVRYTVFNGSTVVPEGEDDNPGSNHVNTWRVAYTIDGLKQWLFSCSK